MYIIVATTGGLIDHVEIRMDKPKTIEIADKLALGKDHEADDVRVFRLRRSDSNPGVVFMSGGIAREIYSAPMPGQS